MDNIVCNKTECSYWSGSGCARGLTEEILLDPENPACFNPGYVSLEETGDVMNEILSKLGVTKQKISSSIPEGDKKEIPYWREKKESNTKKHRL